MIDFVNNKEISDNEYAFNARRYIKIEKVIDEGPDLKQLTRELAECFAEAEKSSRELMKMLDELIYT